MSKAKLNYYLCGGAGINIGIELKQTTRTPVNKGAYLVGLDSSDANPSMGMFDVEHMKQAGSDTATRGSGKKKTTNYLQAEEFVESVITKHKPTDINVVVGSTAGGTGSMLTTLVIRNLAKRNLPFIAIFINDFTSLQEMENAVGTLRSTAAQTSKNFLNTPIPFMAFNNEENVTRGEVNRNIVGQLDLLSIVMTDENEEADYTDIKNTLTYSRHYGVAPALSHIRFFSKEQAMNYEGKRPVAVISLFESKESIVPRFTGTVIRTTGIFAENSVRPAGIDELHMVMDHGEYLGEINQMLSDYRSQKRDAEETFSDHALDLEGIDENGMFL